MGLFDGALSAIGSLSRQILAKDYSMSDFDRDIRMWIGGLPTNTGLTVNELTALRHIVVYACVRVRCETLGCLPLSVYRRRKNRKGADEAWDHPLHQIIACNPNADMTSQTWLETTNGHLDLSGNGYSIITTNKRGQVVDLYPWDWHMIIPRRNDKTGGIEYQLNNRGAVETVPPEKVFHLVGMGYDGIRGYSVIRLARESVALGLALHEFSSRYFGQGMNCGMALETDKVFKDQDEIDKVRQQFEERYSGLANSFRPIILHGGLKLNRIPLPLADAQFLEQEKLNGEQICGLFRVPPHLVANLDRATFSNIEQQSIEFMIYDMLPLLTRIERTISWKLFTPAEREQGYFAKFNMDEILRGDFLTRQQGLAIRRQNGTITANEWRALEDDNPVEEPAGDALLVNGNMISIDTAMKQQPRQTGGGSGEANPPIPGQGDSAAQHGYFG